MPIKRLVILLALCLIVSFAFVACGDDDDDDDNDDSGDDGDFFDDDDYSGDDDDDSGDDDDDDTAGDVWTDPATGLMWQDGATVGSVTYNGDKAQIYCSELSWGGYDDWQLPTISELRSLIRGCERTETGGTCGVTDSCLDTGECWSTECYGCLDVEGPGPNGAFWIPELSGSKKAYWSASQRTGYEDHHWYVSFLTGRIDQYHDVWSYGARCVR